MTIRHEFDFYAAEVAAKNVNSVPRREEVGEEECWDLTPMFSDDSAWEKSYLEQSAKVAEIAKQGKVQLDTDSSALFTVVKTQEALAREIEKLYVYAHLKRDQDVGNGTYSAMYSRAMGLVAQAEAAAAWFKPALAAIPESTLESFLNENSEYQHYRQSFERIRKGFAHMLSDKEEYLLASLGEVIEAPAQIRGILDSADQKFPSIRNEQGELVELSQSRFSRYIESRDRRVRKEAFENLYSIYGQYRNTYAATLQAVMKMHNRIAELRGFKSAREAALFATAIPEDVYDRLVEQINLALPELHRYVELRRRLLKLDEIHSYDLYVPVVEAGDEHYSFEEACSIIKKALEPLGADYQKILDEAIAARWVDRAENAGKRNGAYSSGCYDSAPYILISWQGTLDNVFTLAHELGHSGHSWLTRHNQKFVYGDYGIFLAEIASTLNENLLARYMMARENDPTRRMRLLMRQLDGFKGTVFRQTQFAEFELLCHQADQAGVALTADYLSQSYGELNRKYYGSGLSPDPQIELEWARIPHFFYNYYVFQYATGYSAAASFAEMIMNEGQTAVDRYLNFLSAGSSDYPVSVLQKAGVDMTRPEAVQLALQSFTNCLNELEALSNKGA